MMITLNEKEILRELAKKYTEIAAHEANAERAGRMRSVNSLRPVRPPVLVNEIPWHEMDIEGELQLRCENTVARQMEFYFRSMLYRWKYIQADMVADINYYVNKSFVDSGIGITVKETIISSDDRNYIVSHHYDDQLDSEEKVRALHCPEITAQPDIDRKNLESAEEILYGIMPVKLRGYGMYYSPWDMISTLRGVERVLTDLVERPELLHKTIGKFTDIYQSRYNQMEELGLLEYNIPDLHGTPPYVDSLPAADYDGGRVRFKDVWFRGMAQIFGTVSPAMHEEFDLQYMRSMMDKCGLSYYGCCEPLDNKIDMLSKVPNMRKIGVSPWANVRGSAEKISSRYVFAHKPNPAFVAGNFDPDMVRREIGRVIEACLENACPYEFVLKDISTVSYKPQNLIAWVKTVNETIDKYYL